MDAFVVADKTRGWCRAEIVSRALSNPLGKAYVVDEHGCRAIKSLVDFALDDSSKDGAAMQVFSGTFTCCDKMNHELQLSDGTTKTIPCDKERLMIPMLGMYYEALKQYYSEEGLYQHYHGLNVAGLVSADDGWQSKDDFLERIALDRGQFFPEDFTAIFNGRETTKKLFGELAKQMAERVQAVNQPLLQKRLQDETSATPRRIRRMITSDHSPQRNAPSTEQETESETATSPRRNRRVASIHSASASAIPDTAAPQRTMP
jgi:hypothetical protein